MAGERRGHVRQDRRIEKLWIDRIGRVDADLGGCVALDHDVESGVEHRAHGRGGFDEAVNFADAERAVIDDETETPVATPMVEKA
jgi:hypothetical protein